MSELQYNYLSNIQVAFKTLRQYNQYVLFPVSESAFENPILIEYFDSPLDAPIERKVEKILCTAAVKAVYENRNISSGRKEACAKRTAQDLREAMRIAKLEYHAKEKDVSIRDYYRRKRSLNIVKYAARIKKAKKTLKSFTIDCLIRTVAGSTSDVVSYGTKLVWNVLPDKVREPIVVAAKELKEKAINTIEKCCTYIKNTAVGKAVTKAVEKCKPFFKKIEYFITNTTKKSIEKIKSQSV